MELIPQGIDAYMKGLLPERHQRFVEMEQYAEENKFPIVGPLAANFLAQQAASIGAKRIMELGSGFGYSALWFSSILPVDGSIICTDGEAANKERAMDVFKAVRKDHLLDFRVGDALTTFESIDGEFDFIFCDIDKHEYPSAFVKAFPRLRKGGMLAFDNCLWSGRMLEGDESDATKGVVELNQMAFSALGCHASIIPIRDGLLLCRKL
jgi:predicted O-methyltransferase YrrM